MTASGIEAIVAAYVVRRDNNELRAVPATVLRHRAASSSLLGGPVRREYVCRIKVPHLRNFFAQNANDLNAHFRVAPQQTDQLSTRNKVQTTVSFGFGGKTVWFS